MNTRHTSIKLLAIAGTLGLSFAPSAMAQMDENLLDMEAPEAAVEAVTEEEVAQVPGSIVDIVSADEQFSTLEAALLAADLVEPLQGDGPFTVFAPYNSAFEVLPPGVVEALLLPENQDLLTELLAYHVLPGAVTASELSDGSYETLSGEEVPVTVIDGEVGVGDSADVVIPDVLATNGVVHIIDSVLIPTNVAAELESRLGETETMTEEDTMMPEQTTTQEPQPTVQEETAPATPTPAAEPVRGLW